MGDADSPRRRTRPLATTSVALKIAREATDAVPIAKQILGVAVHISEFAERVQERRDDMYELIEKAGIYASEINATVGGRVLDAQLHRRLERLLLVFEKIEQLVAKEASDKGRFVRRMRNLFVAPVKAEKLAAELEREIKLFELTATLDARIAANETARLIEDGALYDGEFRRLRYCDVEVERVLRQCRVEGGTLTWARARIHNSVMIVRFLRASDDVPQVGAVDAAWSWYPERIKKISTLPNWHRNVVRMYGWSNGGPETTFVAFRAGTYDFKQYASSHIDNLSDGPRIQKRLDMAYKILDAARHVKHTMGASWAPRSSVPAEIITVDDLGEPSIGVFEDIDGMESWKDGAWKTIGCVCRLLVDWAPERWEWQEAVPSSDFDDMILAISRRPGSDTFQSVWAQLRPTSLQVYKGSVTVPTRFSIDSPPMGLETKARAEQYMAELIDAAGPANAFFRYAMVSRIFSSGNADKEDSEWLCSYHINKHGDLVSIDRIHDVDGFHRVEKFQIIVPPHMARRVRLLLRGGEGGNDRELEFSSVSPGEETESQTRLDSESIWLYPPISKPPDV
ncbi:hypothetical protein EXIGLDRAFT_767594 [Exidia glandulosa HHB12029]|uniref:Uncharacterized protein n=1 Tax=Exidia glandulosa HHB12029 TaxID=1314781 RepID=A0A165IVI1_EXIGL|nr:hypothetical protein EXIGLDRAFT_767594 [Exidia glandulosa HHB12029]